MITGENLLLLALSGVVLGVILWVWADERARNLAAEDIMPLVLLLATVWSDATHEAEEPPNEARGDKGENRRDSESESSKAWRELIGSIGQGDVSVFRKAAFNAVGELLGEKIDETDELKRKAEVLKRDEVLQVLLRFVDYHASPRTPILRTPQWKSFLEDILSTLRQHSAPKDTIS